MEMIKEPNPPLRLSELQLWGSEVCGGGPPTSSDTHSLSGAARQKSGRKSAPTTTAAHFTLKGAGQESPQQWARLAALISQAHGGMVRPGGGV